MRRSSLVVITEEPDVLRDRGDELAGTCPMRASTAEAQQLVAAHLHDAFAIA